MPRSLIIYDGQSGEILLRIAGYAGDAPEDPTAILPLAPPTAKCKIVGDDLPELLPASRVNPMDETVIPARIVYSPPVSYNATGKVVIVTPHGFVAGTTKYNIALAQALLRQGKKTSIFFLGSCSPDVASYLEELGVPFAEGSPAAAVQYVSDADSVVWHGDGGPIVAFITEFAKLSSRPHSTLVLHMESDFLMAAYAAPVVERLVVVGRWMLKHFPYATWCPPPAVIEPQAGNRDERTIVYLGRLAEHKGLENLVSSLCVLEDFRLVLVGAGPLHDPLITRAKELGCADRLTVVDGDLRATRHLSRGGIFVLASESEGASVALVEAIAAGLKVVATPVGDAPWLAEEKGVPITIIPNNQVNSIVSGVVQSHAQFGNAPLPPQYSISYFEQVWRHTLPLSPVEAPAATTARPKVSVLMPVYGYKHLMDGAIASVLNQSDALEVVVVDNGNQDDTLARLQDWQQRDPRVKPVSVLNNVGLSGARNQALRAATGEWVCLLDPDDRYMPGFIEPRLALMGADRRAVLSCGQALAVRDGQPQGIMPSAPYDRAVQSGNNRVLCQSVMMPHWAAVAAGGNEPWRYAEDWGLWARLASAGEVLFDGRPVYELHAHAQQRSRITSEGLWDKYACNLRAAFHNAFCYGFTRPLSILMVLPDLEPNGAQHAALQIALRLKAAGHGVDVLSLMPYWAPPSEWAESGLSVSCASGWDNFLQMTKSGRYDVAFIHCWSGSGIIASTHCSLPAVVVHHSVEADTRPPNDDRALRLHVSVAPYGRAKFSFEPVTDGEPATNTYICNGVDTDRINSVRVGKQQAREELGIPMDQKLVVSVTRADREKGADILMDVPQHVADDVKFVAIGVAPGQALYETVMSNFVLFGVESKGVLPWEQVVRWLEAADVLLVPSRREAHSLVVMESLALGTLVVGAASALPSEDIRGLYRVSAPDARQLAEALSQALSSGETVGPLPEEWSWETIAFKYGAALRLLALRDKWTKCERNMEVPPQPPINLAVTLELPETARLVSFGLMVKMALERAGVAIVAPGESRHRLALSADGRFLEVYDQLRLVGRVYFDPALFGQAGPEDRLCPPPIIPAHVTQGPSPICVGDVPLLRNAEARPAAEGPADFAHALYAVVGDWLDAVYAQAAGIPVASVANSYGLTCNWYSGVTATPDTVGTEAGRIDRETWAFYADNIRRYGARWHAPKGELARCVAAMLGGGE